MPRNSVAVLGNHPTVVAAATPIRSRATTAPASGASQVVNAPATIVTGDLLVMAILQDANNPFTSPGWTQRGTVVDSVNNLASITVLTKIATGAESATYTLTAPGYSVGVQCVIFAINAVTSTTVTFAGVSDGFTASLAIPSVTAAFANPLLIGFGGAAQLAGGPFVASAGWSPSVGGTGGSGTGYEAYTTRQATVAAGGATPTGTLTPTGSINGVSAVLAVYP